MQELMKMEELKNLFFYTLHIVPLQYYNVVGDGITDNRLKIQQAIYDAIEVGAKYIFVPKGEYYYSNVLFQADQVVFIGNESAKIKNIQIEQFPEFTPLGGIIIYAGTNVPANYLECNGQAVKIESYKVPNLSTGQSGTKYIIRAK